jgi:hypothetical protein
MTGIFFFSQTELHAEDLQRKIRELEISNEKLHGMFLLLCLTDLYHGAKWNR